MPRVVWGVVLAGAVGVLAGCGLGEKAARKAAEAEPVTKAQLAAMVVPAAEVRASIKGLRVDSNVGLVSNTEAAQSSLDPDDSAETVKADGRIAGHKLLFTSTNVARPKGKLELGTEVDLYDDVTHATQVLHERLSEYERFGNARPGLRIATRRTFEAPGIGDESAGRVVKFVAPGVVAGDATEVVFRRGPIVAIAWVMRADRKDATQEALQLAVKLDRRIRDVLAGRIEVEKTEPPPEESKITAADVKRLPSLTLAAADLGSGVAVAAEGRRDDESFKGYYRDFRDLVVGGSHLIALRSETLVFETPFDAELQQKVLNSEAGRLMAADEFVQGFAEEGAVKPADVRVRTLRKLGRGLTGMNVTFDLVGAEFKMVAVFARSGRTIQAVWGICRETLNPRDMVWAAERARGLLAT